MSPNRRAKRKVARPYIRRGSSVLEPAWQPNAVRSSAADSLSSTSDQLMWWGWGIAIAFVVAGLTWHVLTYQPVEDLKAGPAEPDQLVECDILRRQ